MNSDLNLYRYISKSLFTQHNDLTITDDGKNMVNKWLTIFSRILIEKSNILGEIAFHPVLSLNDFRNALRVWLSDNEDDFCVLDEYASNTVQRLKKAPIQSTVSRQKKAGIIIPVSRIESFLKERTIFSKVSKLTSIYFAAVIDYMLKYLCNISGNITFSDGRKRVTCKDIIESASSNVLLNKILKMNSVFIIPLKS